MKYKRSIGTIRHEDYQIIIHILDDYLGYVQRDLASTNDQINDIKLMIQKLQHHIELLARHNYWGFY